MQGRTHGPIFCSLPGTRGALRLYLRPSLAMGSAQAGIHDLLARQYGLHAAGRFPPHATVKGFFRSTVGAADLSGRLGRLASVGQLRQRGRQAGARPGRRYGRRAAASRLTPGNSSPAGVW
jgi:hypothetical protein